MEGEFPDNSKDVVNDELFNWEGNYSSAIQGCSRWRDYYLKVMGALYRSLKDNFNFLNG
jgi:hypothetical protein